MLTILLLIPFLGALLISVLPSEGSSERTRTLSVITLVSQCVLSFGLLLPFSAAEPGMQCWRRSRGCPRSVLNSASLLMGSRFLWC